MPKDKRLFQRRLFIFKLFPHSREKVSNPDCLEQYDHLQAYTPQLYVYDAIYRKKSDELRMTRGHAITFS